jgi:hypothetical protein
MVFEHPFLLAIDPAKPRLRASRPAQYSGIRSEKDLRAPDGERLKVYF